MPDYTQVQMHTYGRGAHEVMSNEEVEKRLRNKFANDEDFRKHMNRFRWI